jgi:4-amino-4-deoxy-L-arabinose transferase-like glycosyltransferase
VILVAASLAINIGIARYSGIHIGVDSRGYIDSATAFLTGTPSVDRPGGWVLLRFIIAGSLSLTGGLVGVIAIQIAAAALAVWSTYELAREIGGITAAVGAALTLLVNIDVARFHVYVLTDSLYTSLLVFATLAIVRAGFASASWWWRVVAVLVLALEALLRPNGWLLPLVAIAYWAWMPLSTRWRVILSCTLVLLTVAATAYGPVRDALAFEQLDVYIRSGQLVTTLQDWTVPMPADPNATSAVLYVWRHPAESLALGFGRILAEVVHIRPVYSTAHNGLIVLVLLPLYGLAVVGWTRYRSTPLVGLITALIVLHLLTVAIKGADWDGRYLLFIMPLISVLAACGAVAIYGQARRLGFERSVRLAH